MVILDGWGVAPPNRGNAITLAKTPTFDYLKKKYLYTELCAHGSCVGLPKGQTGNSEAGHLNLGAGRRVWDDAVYISKSIEDGTFFKNPAFREAILRLKNNKSKIHLIGLITEENSAHSSPEHWLAMLRLLHQENVSQVFLHLFTDGRDSGQHAAVKILERFEQKINHNHNGNLKVIISSISGRFYAMDRTKSWPRIEKVYNLLTLGEGLPVADAKEAIVQAYNRQETDEFITPTIITKDHRPLAIIEDNDVVIFMNLRSDRARELTKAFCQKEFNKKNPGSFQIKKPLKNLFFVTLSDFGPDLNDIRTAYPSRTVKNSLPIVLDGLRQLYIAETEKYAHVTFFFNGGYDYAVMGEERIVIPSPDVSHYDLTPEMNASKVRKKIIDRIRAVSPDFILVNFCNLDMLGHTGNLKAAIKSAACVDYNLGKLLEAGQKEKYCFVVTADHGNAEEMINLKTGEIETTHTINPVPFILVASGAKKKKLRGPQNVDSLKHYPILADVAPTVLEIMGIEKPKEMTGTSLILK